MSSRELTLAAERVGISLEQARALIEELSRFTHGMASAGDVGIPPFAWPEDSEDLLRKAFPGWEGLTRGEFNGTRASVIWRAVCDYLLHENDYHGWEDSIWPHPRNGDSSN